jgi:hypothetical protein
MFSEGTKEKLADWGRRLECPVDEDANYENTYVSSLSFLSCLLICTKIS